MGMDIDLTKTDFNSWNQHSQLFKGIFKEWLHERIVVVRSSNYDGYNDARKLKHNFAEWAKGFYLTPGEFNAAMIDNGIQAKPYQKHWYIFPVRMRCPHCGLSIGRGFLGWICKRCYGLGRTDIDDNGLVSNCVLCNEAVNWPGAAYCNRCFWINKGKLHWEYSYASPTYEDVLRHFNRKAIGVPAQLNLQAQTRPLTRPESR